eukprot:TRINITY_DN4648_c0_g1_i3.p2 TRINITY_DN4648_c0_g1~~TRINITY_DN4648_c0_g1_i3.p2  ORF type:complete len:147 (+),score=28.96 TRINITY_DN4648_c0_g1_i3:228-668(+)
MPYHQLTCDERPSLGGKRAATVSAGYNHIAVLLEDGSVRCFGGATRGECDVPADLACVVSCSCGSGFTAALCEDGSVRWWGDAPQHRRLQAAGRCVAMSCGRNGAAVVTADGTVVAEGDDFPYRRSQLSRTGAYTPFDLAGRALAL